MHLLLKGLYAFYLHHTMMCAKVDLFSLQLCLMKKLLYSLHKKLFEEWMKCKALCLRKPLTLYQGPRQAIIEEAAIF